MSFYVYEAEYRIKPETRGMDWTNPDPDTVKLHGPFSTEADANEKAAAQAWAKVDLCYHRVAVTISPDFDPTDPTTHDLVLKPDLYWGRTKTVTALDVVEIEPGVFAIPGLGLTTAQLKDMTIVWEPWGFSKGHAIDLGYDSEDNLVGIKIWDNPTK